jgi:G3E family GTPase
MTSIPTSSIPVHVIGGYLGSGKTTLLNALLSASQEPIAVIVNDFGEVNIDAALISAQHDDVIELTNGCICCAVGTSLADVLFTILDREQLPSLIVIEASGVADPAAVVTYTHMAGLHISNNYALLDRLI